MNKIKVSLICLFIGVFLVQCAKNPTEPTDNSVRELTSLEKSLVEADNTFGLKLFQALNENEKNDNVFISPLSISMALGMTLNGADGSTKQAMQQVLEVAGFTEAQINSSYRSLMQLLIGLDPKVKFKIANSIWYRSTFKVEESFKDVNKTYFNAEVTALNFDDPLSVNVINSWVYDNTNGKIDKIVDRIDPYSIMFLINAIYFKGMWTYQFDESKTFEAPFYLPDNSEKQCQMMVQSGNFSYMSNDEFQAVDLPYGDKYFSMTLILPQPGKDIEALIANLNSDNWQQWIGQFTEEEGDVYLPKFSLKYEKTLNDVLIQLGMGIAFSDQANFTKINKDVELYISEVKHKAFVEVNEEGTEAAAVTSVEIRYTSVGDSGFVMLINRPFIFAIRENHSGTILFIGKIVDPT